MIHIIFVTWIIYVYVMVRGMVAQQQYQGKTLLFFSSSIISTNIFVENPVCLFLFCLDFV